jgi:hypothetical protein
MQAIANFSFYSLFSLFVSMLLFLSIVVSATGFIFELKKPHHFSEKKLDGPSNPYSSKVDNECLGMMPRNILMNTFQH